MDEPFFVDCPKDKWTLVFKNAMYGEINRKSEEPSVYFYTYRVAGEAAPTTIDEGVKLFINSVISEPMSFYEKVDVYIWTTEADGRVLIDGNSDSLELLALVLAGEVLGNYTRPGEAWGSDIDDNIIEFEEDEPPSTFINGEKRFLQYNGINYVPNPLNPELWIRSGGASYNPTTNEFTIPQNGQVKFAELTTTSYQNKQMIGGVQIELVSGAGALRMYDGASATTESFSASCYCTTTQTQGSAASALWLYVQNFSTTPLVVRFSEPQLDNKDYIGPFIPVGNQTVNAGVSTILADDPLAELPFTSDLGTPFGIVGLIGGVDGNLASGQANIIRHMIHDLSVDTILGKFELNNFIMMWVEAITGLIYLTDGTNTAVSNTPVIAGVQFTAFPRWENGIMWIEKDGSQGFAVPNTGFPEIGGTFTGIIENYQTNGDFSFSK